jgi:hypothetical protein
MASASLKAKFVPWHRTLAQVIGLGSGVALWLVGTAGAPPIGWQATVAWVPFVALAVANLRWHREANMATDRAVDQNS